MPTITPNEASKRTGRSRRTIMRAIDAGELTAHRDNRNQWRIAEGSLAQWAPTEHAQPDAQPLPTPKTDVLDERIRGLECLLEEMRRERDDLRNDRDAWREMATRPWWKRLAG